MSKSSSKIEMPLPAPASPLARTPSNGWALRGLMEVYRVRGDAAALAAAKQRFATTWLGQPEGPALSSL